MSAKVKLLERLSTLEETISMRELANQQIADIQHNRKATFLRKGLGIVTFNILEDYIKERSAEMFLSISSSLIRFSDLPPELQEAATIGALKALSSKAREEKKNKGNWLNLIQQESSYINSTALMNGFTISKLSLMNENSNVHPDDIPKALKCLNIDGGWSTLQRISQEIYGGIPNLHQSYMNISLRRHQAAHEAAFDYELGWLDSAISEIRSIAASFDIALTARCRELANNPATPMRKDNLSNALNYRFLVHNNTDSTYSEKKNATSRAIKIWTDLQISLQNIVPKCRAKNEFLIVLNTQLRISDWHS